MHKVLKEKNFERYKKLQSKDGKKLYKTAFKNNPKTAGWSAYNIRFRKNNPQIYNEQRKYSAMKVNENKKNKTLEESYGVEKATEIKKKISLKTQGKNNAMYGKVVYPKLKYNEQLKHSTRSNWETNTFLKFKDLNINYVYEPNHYELLIKNKQVTYTPDAQIINTNILVEIKGPLFDWQVEKMKCFKEQYPNLKLIAITNNRRNHFEKLKFCDKIIDYNKFIKEGDKSWLL